MAGEFLDYVRHYLGDGARLSAPDRQVRYAHARDQLYRSYREAGYSEQQCAAGLRSLDDAIAQIERQFAPGAPPTPPLPPAFDAPMREPPSRFDRNMEKAGSVYSMFKAGHAFIAFGLSLASDFLKPILELTMPVMFIGGIGALALYFISRRSMNYR